MEVKLFSFLLNKPCTLSINKCKKCSYLKLLVSLEEMVLN